MIPPSLLIMNRRVIFTDYHCMDNIESVHKGLHLYLVILFLLVVSRILAFNFMLMSVKIRRYRAIIIIIKKINSRWIKYYIGSNQHYSQLSLTTDNKCNLQTGIPCTGLFEEIRVPCPLLTVAAVLYFDLNKET